jgi:hypothetical protein
MKGCEEGPREAIHKTTGELFTINILVGASYSKRA